jgi:exonuclease SbcC
VYSENDFNSILTMRPIQLTIKNFLSYGEIPQTVDFSEHTIISFIGNNGHGKSAILESITWALWGMARRSQGVTKSDDMIMHTGSTDMSVSLTFQVKQQIYRVQRICQKKHNRLYSGLEFFLIKTENEEKNLSLHHQRETQQLIDSVIGIDYETFINTVYLKQGQSNEFSKKSPKERKDILCSILKLNDIEKIREKILVDVKKLLQERTIKQAIKERYHLEEKKISIEKQIEIIEEIKTKEQEINETETKTKESYQNSKQSWENMLNDQAAEKQKEIEQERAFTLLHHQYSLQEGEYKKYKTYMRETQSLLQKINYQEELDIMTLQEKLKNINEEISLIQKKREEAQKEIFSHYEKEVKKIEESYEQKEKEHKTTIEYVLGRKEEISSLLTLASKAKDYCFFCNEPTVKNHTKIEKSIDYYETKKKDLEKDILEKEIKTKTDKKAYIQKKEEQEKALKKNLEKHEKSTTEMLNSILTEKEKIEKQLLDGMSSFKDKKTIELYREEIKKIKKKIDFTAIKGLINSIYNIKKEQKLEKSEKEKKQRYAEAIAAEYKKYESEYHAVQKKKELIITERKEKEAYCSFLKNQYEKEEKESTIIQTEITAIEQDLEVRSNLAHLLSKNNLQAALIEEAIPLIENEANHILDKLTEGRCKIYIDSMKDLKSGEIKETLDIKIADAFGLRYYEFFSGGESFKIDLALRIALVKLLTQKSGHAIRTFIIDEGFGSQDAQSLEKMIDVLYALQNEFDLIILISHLSDMKEQFPGQFFIRKTPTGSLIQKI